MITSSTTSQKELVPPLVKVRDVASLLSVSRHTVHHLIDSGDLDASEINASSKKRRHLRITRASLLGFYKKRFGHSLTRALANPFEP
ncbi:MAG: helix-turn-helix domain-containing protein [Methylacidiphilales bacterium]|nr:helix-turn-helix domain-containing protein [Candidatus Methylacidiphilales bacterium]